MFAQEIKFLYFCDRPHYFEMCLWQMKKNGKM